jgi:hypothetical protein
VQSSHRVGMLRSRDKLGHSVSVGLADEFDAKKIRNREGFRQAAFWDALLFMLVLQMLLFVRELQFHSSGKKAARTERDSASKSTI